MNQLTDLVTVMEDLLDSFESKLYAAFLRAAIASMERRIKSLESPQTETLATGGGNGRVTMARVKPTRQPGRGVNPRAACHRKLMRRIINGEKGQAFEQRRDMSQDSVLATFREKANHALSDADIQRIWSASEGEFRKAVESLARARVLTSVIGGRSVGTSQCAATQNPRP